MSTIIFDNGADTIKVGYAGHTDPIKVIPNCIFKPKREKKYFIADQVSEIIDNISLLHKRPHEKGYLTNFESEKEIWDRVFGKRNLDVNTTEASLILTEPVFNFPVIQNKIDELVFETFKFSSYLRASGPFLTSWINTDLIREVGEIENLYAPIGSSLPPVSKMSKPFDSTACLIVDLGFSFTHCTPVFDHIPINYAIRRLDVGGKLITNWMKESVSKQVNLRDEFIIVNAMKESTSFVSMDFKSDIKLLNSKINPLSIEYLLPNGSSRLTGVIREYSAPKENAMQVDEEIVKLGADRFVPSETLFSPSLVSIPTCGLPELIVDSISQLPEDIRNLFYSNILLVGGVASTKGLAQRLKQDLTSLAPCCPVNIFMESNPSLSTWHGASRFGLEGDPSYKVTLKEYHEYGHNICNRKFFM